jgi:hypothetical protein
MKNHTSIEKIHDIPCSGHHRISLKSFICIPGTKRQKACFVNHAYLYA